MVDNKIELFIGASAAASPLNDVVGMPGLKWSVQCYPLGQQNNRNAPEVTIRVLGGSAKVLATIKACYFTNSRRVFLSQSFETLSHFFANGEEYGWEILRPPSHQYFQITCTAIFENCTLLTIDRSPASIKPTETVNVKDNLRDLGLTTNIRLVLFPKIFVHVKDHRLSQHIYCYHTNMLEKVLIKVICHRVCQFSRKKHRIV